MLPTLHLISTVQVEKLRSDQSISRILYPVKVTSHRMTIIHLGRRLPDASCDLPGNTDGLPLNIPLFGLAPGGVYKASPVTRRTGALLPHLFTLTLHSSTYKLRLSAGRYFFCCTVLHVAATPCYGAPCPMVFGLSSRS